MAFHFLEQGFVGGEEREAADFGQGNIDSSIIGRDLIGLGDDVGLAEEVPRELTAFKVKVL